MPTFNMSCNRRYKGPQCYEKGRYFEMTTDHDHLIECPAQELPCPNECGDIVVYCNLGKHCRSVCPNEGLVKAIITWCGHSEERSN